jgi:hypothetical protein
MYQLMGSAHTIWMISVVFSMAKPVFDVLLDASLHPLALDAMRVGRGTVIYYQQAFCFFFLFLLPQNIQLSPLYFWYFNFYILLSLFSILIPISILFFDPFI